MRKVSKHVQDTCAKLPILKSQGTVAFDAPKKTAPQEPEDPMGDATCAQGTNAGPGRVTLLAARNSVLSGVEYLMTGEDKGMTHPMCP